MAIHRVLASFTLCRLRFVFRSLKWNLPTPSVFGRRPPKSTTETTGELSKETTRLTAEIGGEPKPNPPLARIWVDMLARNIGSVKCETARIRPTEDREKLAAGSLKRGGIGLYTSCSQAHTFVNKRNARDVDRGNTIVAAT